jgi:succinate-semialdehyde dehydrogenase/glutarate-semialdehyde dehydrogenase
MTQRSINPATEETLAEFPEHSAADVERMLDAAAAAARAWRATGLDERRRLMQRAGAYLREHRDQLAGVMTAEMGKPIAESEAEIEKCAWNCDFYADHAAAMLADEPAPSGATQSYVTFDPLGVVLAIMPWNFPFWQVFRFAAPALMAGNVAVLKHASNVPQCALAIERVFRESGFPAAAFQTLLIDAAAVDDLIADPRIAAVTLTGSDATGSKVAAASGRALKKTVLELGGSDPFVVLADADIEAAAAMAVRARFINTGQSCIAAKRFIAVDAIADEFSERFTQGVGRLVVGNPADRATQIGPLARGDLRDGVGRQVRRSQEMGARVLTGGTAIEGAGYFFAPTVVDHAGPGQPVYEEETFGPVAAVIRVPDEAAAVAAANDSPYGLGAAIWTRDIARAQALAHQIEAGSVFINGMVVSDPRLPFGGIKRSGYGRELSHFGLREFVNIKTVWIGPQRDGRAAAHQRVE